VNVLQRWLVKWILGGGDDIYAAAQAGDVSRVRALLAVDPALAKRRDGKRPLTLLHLAASQDNVALAEVLLAHGVDINAVDPLSGRTPLHVAASLGHRKITRFLLARGADVQARDARGLTPRELAQHAQRQVVAELLTHGARPYDDT